jgi:hypothetical protein
MFNAASGKLKVCTRRAIRSPESNWPNQLLVVAGRTLDASHSHEHFRNSGALGPLHLGQFAF